MRPIQHSQKRREELRYRATVQPSEYRTAPMRKSETVCFSSFTSPLLFCVLSCPTFSPDPRQIASADRRNTRTRHLVERRSEPTRRRSIKSCSCVPSSCKYLRESVASVHTDSRSDCIGIGERIALASYLRVVWIAAQVKSHHLQDGKIRMHPHILFELAIQRGPSIVHRVKHCKGTRPNPVVWLFRTCARLPEIFQVARVIISDVPIS